MSSLTRHGMGYWSMAAAFSVIWSLGFPITKLVIPFCPPETFLGFRFLTSGTLLLGWAVWRGYRAGSIPWLRLAALGLVTFGMSNGLAWGGMTTVGAGTATIILSASPVLVGLIGAVALSDRLSPTRAAGLALGMGGVVFVVRNRIELNGEDWVGTLMVTGSLFTQTAGTIIYKRWSPRLPLSILVGTQQFVAGAVLLAIGIVFEDTSHIALNGVFWSSLVYMAILNSIVSFQLWFFMLSRGSATSVASIQFVMPPLGLGFSWLMLGEKISALDLIGLVPIALGIWLTTRPSPKPSVA